MRTDAFLLVFVSLGLSVLAQTITVTFPNNGRTEVQVFTTNDDGFPVKTTIATLSGSTTPPPTPSTPSPVLIQTTSSQTSTTRSTAGPTTIPSNKKGQKGIPTGIIAGIVIAVLLVLAALALTLFFLKRRKTRRRRVPDDFEIDPATSPIIDKSFFPDPFITDEQAKGMGFDLSRQATRHLDAKFLSIEERTSESQNRPLTPASSIPRILVTREGEISGRPITPSSSGHHRPQSLVGHTQNAQYSLDVKSASGPNTVLEASPGVTRGEGSSSTRVSSQEDIARRMRDLLSQMEHHIATPTSGASDTVVQLQRQVEMLRQENEELRLTGTEAPPAYENGGRF